MHLVTMADSRDAPTLNENHVVADLFLRRQNPAGVNCCGRHGRSCYPNFAGKIQPSLASVACSLQSWLTSDSEENGCHTTKSYVAQKRQRRRRKVAKAKVKLYEDGKAPPRQAACPCQKVPEPENASSEESRISKKRGTRSSRMPLFGAVFMPSRQGRRYIYDCVSCRKPELA